jgi:hypothetical protein
MNGDAVSDAVGVICVAPEIPSEEPPTTSTRGLIDSVPGVAADVAVPNASRW